MVFKVGGIDSGYVSIGKPEQARTMGDPNQLSRKSPAKDKSMKDQAQSRDISPGDDFESFEKDKK